MTTPDRMADALRTVALRLERELGEGRRSSPLEADDLRETLLAIADLLDPPVDASRRPSVVEAAKALLEAREDQMVTQVEWDRLREAVDAAEREG